MKKIKYKIVFILLINLLSSCFSNKSELTGQKKVEGSNNLYVKIYQRDEFERVTPISFELLNDDDSVLIAKKFLTGTDVRNEKIERFYPFLYDSIFYICYPYPVVHALQHLDPSKSQLSRDTLFKLIKAHDPKLIDDEKQ